MSNIVGGEDYTAVNSHFDFQPQPEGQSTSQCSNVSIMDDNVLEATEMFTIELQGIDASVSVDLSANTATVVIMDNDSRLRHYICMAGLNFLHLHVHRSRNWHQGI